MDWLSVNWYWLGPWFVLMYFGYYLGQQHKLIMRLQERVNILEHKTKSINLPDDAW